MNTSDMKRLAVYTFFGGLIFTIFALIPSGGVSVAAERYRIFADAATLAAVLLLSVGALSAISDGGFFDIFLYSLSRLSLVFSPLPRGEVSYADFKAKRREHSGGASYVPLLVGAFFLLVSVLFTVLYYRA